MRLLLDTHTLVWWWTNARQLSATARKAISNQRNEVLVSAACAWEIATKQRLGKLGLPELTMRRYSTLLVEDGFESLPVTTLHALAAGSACRQPWRPLRPHAGRPGRAGGVGGGQP